jgi:hypothetical protein
MIRRSVRSTTAALLVVLIGILNTGMPSHSHESDEREASSGHVTVSGDSHSHGVILIDSEERVPSPSVRVPALAIRIETTSITAPDRRLHTFEAAPLRPSERGPPPASPRAPPQLI